MKEEMECKLCKKDIYKCECSSEERAYDLDITLRMCPFCGSQHLDKNTLNPWAYWIQCKMCDAQTLSGESWEEAVENWNHRVE
jgi:Lar family restriction alleviation protein